MNTLSRCALAVLAVGGLAGAATVSCPSMGSPANVDSSLIVMCGGLTFNNFQVVATGSLANPVVSLGTVDNTGGFVNLTFNPNLSAPTGSQALDLFYTVSGTGITGSAVSVGGVNASISEHVCSSPATSEGCPDDSMLASSTVNSAPTGPNFLTSSFGSHSTVYAGSRISAAAGGGLSNFTESFSTSGGGGAVPEPSTVGLMASALLGLGLVGRKRFRRTRS